MTTLILSSRHTADNQALWRAAFLRGWKVERARGIRLPEINDSEIILYIEELFAPTIAESFGRTLLSPAEDWLVRLPEVFTRRRITLTTLGEARRLTGPAFVKPPNDKSFAARVYESGVDLPAEFADDVAVLVAEPVAWELEVRCFCLDGRVRAISPYSRGGGLLADFRGAAAEELSAARELAMEVLAAGEVETPRAIVIDVGQIAGRGWAVVEANGAWGAGIYGCDPPAVLEVVRHATVQPAAFPSV